MKKKSLVLALAATCLSVNAFAQRYLVDEAKENYDKYTVTKTSQAKLAEPMLKSAKEALDKVIVHAKTKEDALAWALRAQLYADLAYYNKSQADATLAAEALSKAKQYSASAKEADKKDITDRMDRANQFLYYYQIQKGKGFFDTQDYTNAYTEFSRALEYNPTDTTANYASGLAAMYLKDYDKAIEKYRGLLSTNYSQLESIYSNLAIMYAAKKDTAGAIQILSEGSAKLPNSTELATREIEFSLMTGKQKEVISKISSQVEKNPANRLYPFYLGIAYSSLADAKSTTEAGRKEASAKAEEAYKKAIAIDPNYADAYINLGGLVMNNGINIYNKANKLPSNKVTEYNAFKKQAIVEFDRAFPYLDKAVQLNPKSELALRNLKTFYSIKNNSAKVAEVDAKLKALK